MGNAALAAPGLVAECSSSDSDTETETETDSETESDAEAVAPPKAAGLTKSQRRRRRLKNARRLREAEPDTWTPSKRKRAGPGCGAPALLATTSVVYGRGCRGSSLLANPVKLVQKAATKISPAAMAKLTRGVGDLLLETEAGSAMPKSKGAGDADIRKTGIVYHFGYWSATGRAKSAATLEQRCRRVLTSWTR